MAVLKRKMEDSSRIYNEAGGGVKIHNIEQQQDGEREKTEHWETSAA